MIPVRDRKNETGVKIIDGVCAVRFSALGSSRRWDSVLSGWEEKAVSSSYGMTEADKQPPRPPLRLRRLLGRGHSELS